MVPGAESEGSFPALIFSNFSCIYNSGIQVWCQDFEHVGAVFLIGTKPLKR